MSGNPFEFLNSINGSKQNMIRGSENPEAAAKDYNKFLTARSLSYHEDVIGIVNELNINGTATHGITPLQHYEFLLYSTPRGRRYGKWLKPEREDEIELVMRFYKYSYERAREIIDLFSEDDFAKMRASEQKGGATK